MTITYLKRGKPAAERDEDDAKVRAAVETTLADIEARGDAAVRELSEKFDNYSPPAFRLSRDEIDGLIARLSERELSDIKFAQEQVVNFAKAQRASMTDIEIETLPGVTLVLDQQDQVGLEGDEGLEARIQVAADGRLANESGSVAHELAQGDRFGVGGRMGWQGPVCTLPA